MSFLAPLYALGVLAVGVPILFHLIQRRPRGEQQFSSLMFLEPSTPRITRRSRLSNLLLLLLRATALILLATAFARPFLRALQQMTLAAPQRHIAILLDQSASMRREPLWEQARAEVQKVLADLGPTDRVALYCFDDRLSPVVGFGHADDAAKASAQMIREELARLQPGWRATDLGRALVEVMDQLRAATAEGNASDQMIVLISDLQQGSRLGTLQTAQWPPDVRLDVRPVKSSQGNASLQWLPPEEGDDSSQLRVRVSSDEQLSNDSFRLVWETDGAGDDQSSAKVVHVPAGRSRVVNLSRRAGQSRLKLLGDAHPFDNVAYLAELQPIEKRVLFVGDSRDEKDRQLFFLRRADLGSLEFPVRIESQAASTAPTKLDPLETPFVILAQPTDAEWTTVLRDYLQQGGRVLVVMDPTEYVADGSVVDSGSLAALLDVEHLQAELVRPDSYAMLADVDFQNPLFLPFAEAKFNDFTKIRIWKYYRLSTDHEQPWSVLARFDDNAVALAERAFGEGRVWILATGWCPDSSQLALSTKFIPLLVSMLGSAIESNVQEQGVNVGQSIDLSQRPSFTEVITPRGQTVALSAEQREYSETDDIGVYQFRGPTQRWDVAVNLDPAESRTAPLDAAELEQRGVLMGAYESAADLDRRERQMRDRELEARQKLWRWLVVAALSVLAIETYLAGRSSRILSSVEPGKE